ncbi:MAG: penicillin-binding protein activator [Bdellovibrionales bacterium]
MPETQSWFGRKDVPQKPVISQAQRPVPEVQPPVYSGQPPLILPQQQPPQPVLPPGVRIKVAILLPLSGKNAALGQAMLNAAQLAVFDVADEHFELMPRDTGSSETGAENAAQDVLARGAQLVIGPVFANDVNRVKPVVNMNGVSMLPLSTDTSLADPNVFVMGFAPGAQVDRVMTYAHARGLHGFAALVPKNAYGDLVARAFQEAAARNGEEIIEIAAYDPARRDSEAAVASLAQKRERIGVLFLPEAGQDIVAISKQLAGAGFDSKQVHLIGTGLWDTPEAGRVEFLLGGWYAAPDPHARQNFIRSYTKTYGQPPPRLATLAYDATALSALLAKRGGRFDRMALTNPSGFAGIDGIFRLTGQGLVERGLAILEVTPAAGKVIDPAPATFAGSNM